MKANKADAASEEAEKLIKEAADRELDFACAYLQTAFESATASCKTLDDIDERFDFLVKALEYEKRKKKNKMSSEVAFSDLQNKFDEIFNKKIW